MTNNIIIGNIISFVAAVLLGLSCWCKNPKRVFIYQFIENLFLSLSSIVFGSYSAAVSTLLSTAKSLVIVKETALYTSFAGSIVKNCLIRNR